ncbi:DUF3300 domain-containing protein [Occallatibacter riparius]|uniref:DUF3300 domain-containing protein n=1 Tax=Occallatibacter riparius TaxID=1002689 RepID=A0A9J7BPI2_9BACT|nr:DUF3300 domain-containing protein [Occallatibacter riparius]UWZ82838.1 DUF3300 domain-containing protein [Occallatibacter riparius]
MGTTPSFSKQSPSLNDLLIQKVRSAIAMALICCMIPLSTEDLPAQEVATVRPQYSQIPPGQLDQLVAPIALYPDALVAQILAAATFSPQIVEADRFVQRNAAMPQPELARAVDAQPWDPSVKALTAFPSVLSNLDHNLQWTGRLGDAYYNQPQDVMIAVQEMRQRAYAAGTLRTSPQLNVIYQPSSIVIRPVNPAVIYVPLYNPWVVYGDPVPIYPAYYYVAPPRPAGVVTAAVVGFAAGVAVGAFLSYGWGCSHWAPNWYSRTIVYNHTTYISRSVTVVNHGYYGRFDHTVAARSFNQSIATRTVVGPHGGTYTDQRAVGDGHYNNTRTMTGPNGATYTDQRSIGNGQYNNTRTVTGANGRTATESTSHYPGGKSTTITGPNGNTGSRTVTGRGTGKATITRTGPRGTKTRTRLDPR